MKFMDTLFSEWVERVFSLSSNTGMVIMRRPGLIVGYPAMPDCSRILRAIADTSSSP